MSMSQILNCVIKVNKDKLIGNKTNNIAYNDLCRIYRTIHIMQSKSLLKKRGEKKTK